MNATKKATSVGYTQARLVVTMRRRPRNARVQPMTSDGIDSSRAHANTSLPELTAEGLLRFQLRERAIPVSFFGCSESFRAHRGERAHACGP